MAISFQILVTLLTMGSLFFLIAFLGKSRAFLALSGLLFLVAGNAIALEGIDTQVVNKWTVSPTGTGNIDINKSTQVVNTGDFNIWILHFITFWGGLLLFLLSLMSWIMSRRGGSEEEFSGI